MYLNTGYNFENLLWYVKYIKILESKLNFCNSIMYVYSDTEQV